VGVRPNEVEPSRGESKAATGEGGERLVARAGIVVPRVRI